MGNVTENNGILSSAGGKHSVVVTVVEKLASQLDCEPTDIEPLATSVNPEALDDIVRASDGVTVTFTHAGYRVEVSGSDTGVSVDVTRSVHVRQ